MSHDPDYDYELEGLREYCDELEYECYEDLVKHYLPIPETDEERQCMIESA